MSDTPVEEWVGDWNVHKMQYADVEGRYGNSRLGVYRINLCEVMVSKA